MYSGNSDFGILFINFVAQRELGSGTQPSDFNKLQIIVDNGDTKMSEKDRDFYISTQISHMDLFGSDSFKVSAGIMGHYLWDTKATAYKQDKFEKLRNLFEALQDKKTDAKEKSVLDFVNEAEKETELYTLGMRSVNINKISGTQDPRT